MEFIAIVGVLISSAVCVLIALFPGWVLVLVVLAYFVVVHVIEVLGLRKLSLAYSRRGPRPGTAGIVPAHVRRLEAGGPRTASAPDGP